MTSWAVLFFFEGVLLSFDYQPVTASAEGLACGHTILLGMQSRAVRQDSSTYTCRQASRQDRARLLPGFFGWCSVESPPGLPSTFHNIKLWLEAVSKHKPFPPVSCFWSAYFITEAGWMQEAIRGGQRPAYGRAQQNPLPVSSECQHHQLRHSKTRPNVDKWLIRSKTIFTENSLMPYLRKIYLTVLQRWIARIQR